MRVLITQSFADGGSGYYPGQELDVPDARGVELLKLGVAERIQSVPDKATQDRNARAVRATR